MSDYPIDHLTSEEAWDVVRTSQAGRIATQHGNAPEIHPVTYVVHDEQIYFRTGVASRLLLDTEDQLVAFEVSWQMMQHISSTVIRGAVVVVSEVDKVAELNAMPYLDFAPQQEYVWMRIAPNEVRGRRLHVIDNTPWREK
ncbi:MAG: pyridoxamine 5'-phosphate oxidase family protein [Aurantimicrobium sp.]|nr:pyridoxamine 5'-phosphate oxidase family protein [Aurantimicrobium sp.]